MRSKTGKLICAALGAGVLSLILRLRLYHVGFDQKHILSFSGEIISKLYSHGRLS